jgi:MoxR-like ATPase
MADFKDVSRDAVLAAIDEFDRLGRDEFLDKYGFGVARDYVVIHEGREYDSKALLGAAFGYEHPEDGPLQHHEFHGGAGTVVPALAKLGFQIVRRSLASGGRTPRVWVIRAGSEGQNEALALQEGVAVLGWAELGRLSAEMSLDDLKDKIRSAGEERAPSIAAQAGQIYRFMHEVQDEDLVILPLRRRSNHVAVGRVAGPYLYREDAPFSGTDAKNTRAVEWLAAEIPYDRFDPDLREAFGQRGTLSEISKPNAAERIVDVLEGADASAIHLVLKWSAGLEARTIDYHLEVVEQRGAVWWGRVGKPGSTGLANDWLEKLRGQLARGSATHVFLHGAASTWRTRLLAITLDRSEVEDEFIPSYYDPDVHHSLWVKITDFEQVDPAELTENFVLAQSGDPVTAGGLGNQTPLIVRKQSALLPGRYFILNQGAIERSGYDDEEGVRYHWTDRSSGAWKQLANSIGARFVYYRPGTADDGTAQTYFGTGRIATVKTEEREDGAQHFVAQIDDFRSFDTPVPWKEGPPRNAQTSIQPITRAQFDKLVELGLQVGEELSFDVEVVRATAERHGLNLAAEIYEQLLGALNSGKHVILTGPPGTAKTTLAQAVAEAARDAGRCSGYTLTTATADWTTFETIGGLRPTNSGQLEFEEGHFLKAIRERRWLVIDELNRSNFDRAFGQLFTVLSGQPVVLPYHRPANDGRPLTLVPEGKESPLSEADILEIPQSWRVLATMNVFDKTLLFEMSFALMRRFAFIEVASPSRAVFEALIDRETGGESKPADVAKRLLVLRNLKDLGPAIFMDIARYVRARMASEFSDEGQLLFEAFYSYLLPQFEGIDDTQGEELFATVAVLVGPVRRERLRRTLNSVLGLDLAAPKEIDLEAVAEHEASLQVTEEPQ